MCENAFGVCVTFAAENFVAVNGKLIKKHLFLGRGFLDELREAGFDRLQFPGRTLKYGWRLTKVERELMFPKYLRVETCRTANV
jgi:hypothetical protein